MGVVYADKFVYGESPAYKLTGGGGASISVITSITNPLVRTVVDASKNSSLPKINPQCVEVDLSACSEDLIVRFGMGRPWARLSGCHRHIVALPFSDPVYAEMLLTANLENIGGVGVLFDWNVPIKLTFHSYMLQPCSIPVTYATTPYDVDVPFSGDVTLHPSGPLGYIVAPPGNGMFTFKRGVLTSVFVRPSDTGTPSPYVRVIESFLGGFNPNAVARLKGVAGGNVMHTQNVLDRPYIMRNAESNFKAVGSGSSSITAKLVYHYGYLLESPFDAIYSKNP